jgi:hypothetical protein
MASTPVHFYRVTISINLDVGVKEAVKTEAQVTVMEFENGDTILDLKHIYEPAVEDIKEAVAAFNSHMVGGGAGGGIVLLIMIAVIIFTCYQWRRCVQQQDVDQ